jgi:hypothetical protein
MAKVIRITSKRACDQFAPRSLGPAKQRQIAALAYALWLDRSFRNGSPQEDWLRALRAICQERLPA